LRGFPYGLCNFGPFFCSPHFSVLVRGPVPHSCAYPPLSLPSKTVVPCSFPFFLHVGLSPVGSYLPLVPLCDRYPPLPEHQIPSSPLLSSLAAVDLPSALTSPGQFSLTLYLVSASFCPFSPSLPKFRKNAFPFLFAVISQRSSPSLQAL